MIIRQKCGAYYKFERYRAIRITGDIIEIELQYNEGSNFRHVYINKNTIEFTDVIELK